MNEAAVSGGVEILWNLASFVLGGLAGVLLIYVKTRFAERAKLDVAVANLDKVSLCCGEWPGCADG